MPKMFLICALTSALTGLGGAPQVAIAAETPPEVMKKLADTQGTLVGNLK